MYYVVTNPFEPHYTTLMFTSKDDAVEEYEKQKQRGESVELVVDMVDGKHHADDDVSQVHEVDILRISDYEEDSDA